jgi:CO/xanthine dehydrogenase Mo-binding subunit
MAVVEKAVAIVPDRLMPGGRPDPLVAAPGLAGQPVSRLDGPRKVTGSAPFAAEFAMDGLLYAALACSTIPKGRIATLDVGGGRAGAGRGAGDVALQRAAAETTPAVHDGVQGRRGRQPARDAGRPRGLERATDRDRMGEIGITGTGAAVANAIFNATGRRVRYRSRWPSCRDPAAADRAPATGEAL